MLRYRRPYRFAGSQAAQTFLSLSAVVVLVLPATAAHAAADPASSARLAEQVATRALQTHDAGREWRTELLPRLRALPQWSQTGTVDGPVSGTIVARTLRLSGTVEVRGDTVIVADWIEFGSGNPRIVRSEERRVGKACRATVTT